MTRRPVALIGISVVAVLTAGACTAGAAAGPGSSGPVFAASPASTLIPQPTPPDLPLVPDSQRVDIMLPTFTNPTKITNPLFPVSAQTSVLHLGIKDGEPFRTEVTTLPYTRVIDWDGQRIEAQVSQYVAFVGDRIEEAAIDWYAQADDGSVWYLGEDVFVYTDGVIANTDGTWLTGKDGPAALIMPGKPAVGQAFRPENIPGLVFEEVTITAVDQTLDGPRGPVPGGLVAGEIHKDGTTSNKLFAPGYGEFQTQSATELEQMALVVPTDALPGPVPAELAAVATSAGDAVGARDQAAAGQAAIDALRHGLDLQLRHRPATEVDLARMDVWGRQLLLDAAAADQAGVHGDIASLKYIRHRVLRAVERADVAKLDALISELADVSGGPDFAAVTEKATALCAAVAAARPAR